ncbi:MAG: 2-amino-4-hydroxy-6-hydroxymethyldihydropteridine diphosphokinase [Reichenbachiella sp.]|uniref:2-amino-4-hydroxy-6- hydroxymethyldihydropteridine diphosphokinase n=1 Tax=Reichenbachiella sp. TaxID=2184521 RepID=UPI003266115B
MSQCFLLLGTNIGNKELNLLQAQELLSNTVGTMKRVSSIYRTAAWGKEDQEDFLNQVICIESILKPEELLDACLNIEKQLGRIRFERWGERLIDIDILYFEDRVVAQDDLTIPHPELQNRRFTLVPLVEIAPDFYHPKLKKTNLTLLEDCTDLLTVTKQ